MLLDHLAHVERHIRHGDQTMRSRRSFLHLGLVAAAMLAERQGVCKPSRQGGTMRQTEREYFSQVSFNLTRAFSVDPGPDAKRRTYGAVGGRGDRVHIQQNPLL